MKADITMSVDVSVRKYGKSLGGFTDVDSTCQPQSLVEYLDRTNTNSVTKSLKQIVLGTLDPEPGDHVLEVGCGVGHMALELATIVGPAGRVTGVDSSAIMIEEAKRRARISGCLPIEFGVEDAHQLSFADDTFDGSFIVSTLIHVVNPKQVLSELLRVIKPGKRIAVQEGDWDTMVLSTGNPEVDDMVVSVLRNSIQNSGIAHQLPTLMKVLGFTDITVGAGTFMTMDFNSANEAWRIQDSVEAARETNAITMLQADTIVHTFVMAEETGGFFGAAGGFVVTGRKPL